MFTGLNIPYIGKTKLSVKKPAARSLRSSLEQLTKSQLELICESYSDERFSKKEELVELLASGENNLHESGEINQKKSKEKSHYQF